MKKSVILMYVFWLVVLAIQIIDIYVFGSKSNNIYDAITLFIMAFFIYYWFITDAGELNIIPSAGLKVSVVLIAFVALPYYLLKYKGFKRTLISFSKVAGFIIIIVAIQYSLNMLGLYA